MEALGSSETSVPTRATRCHIPNDDILKELLTSVPEHAPLETASSGLRHFCTIAPLCREHPVCRGTSSLQVRSGTKGQRAQSREGTSGRHGDVKRVVDFSKTGIYLCDDCHLE
jgi:hypothetical protein